LIITLPPAIWTFTSSTPKVSRVSPFFRLAARIQPFTTWSSKIPVNCFLFSGLSKCSKVPAGNFAKAALVGAKTVQKGQTAESVPTRSAATTALTRSDKAGVASANCTMFLEASAGVVAVIVESEFALQPVRAQATKASTAMTPTCCMVLWKGREARLRWRLR